MRIVTNILLLLLLCFPAYSQDRISTASQTENKSEQIEIYFDLNSSVVDCDFRDNRASLAHLSDLLDRLQRDSLVSILSVNINSFASPEGGFHYNEKITRERSRAIYNYICETTSVPDSLITKQHSGIDWNGLSSLVESSDMKYRDEVLYIINNTPEETWRKVSPNDLFLSLVDSRVKHLMDLKYGYPYNYIKENFFPQLRVGSVVTLYFKAVATPVVEEEVVVEPLDVAAPVEVAPAPEPTEPVQEAVESEMEAESDKKTLKFALKTNLLYDLLLIPTIELEVPIGERWSVAGEWMCPWWVTKNNGNALQILSGQVEGRYWFGDRAEKAQLTGWFGGFYAGGGLYDLQWKNNGYQGEFYIAAGLAGGYAHTINKKGNLRMEYSLGFGYLNTEYRYYEGVQNNEYLVWQNNGRYTWVGPTKLKASLVWFIDWKRGGKR